MPRPSRSKLSPWIEQLILNYDCQEGNSSSTGRLKAHVIGVGQISQSQAHGSEGPTGLLFLSDGVLQIPAILTASAWEHLQEQEDRECFSSLVNTTVCMQDYRVQFHMAPEQTKCRFFLLVGELATTAAGPVKDSTPECTTLPSIRLKIFKMWKALLGVETQESQKSQCAGLDLSELLGEWQHDCLQGVLEDVRERLMVGSDQAVSPLQPSTSKFTSVLTDAFTATRWDVDRVRYKDEECFSVPIKCLFIPELDAEQLHTPPSVGSRTENGLAAASEDRKRDLQHSDAAQSSVDDAQWRIAMPAVAQRHCGTKENSDPLVEDCMLQDDMIPRMLDSNITPLCNPWDIFSPPCGTSSSSEASPEVTPTHSFHQPTPNRSKLDHTQIITSTQLPVHSSKESQHTSEHSKGENSYFTPYQKPPHSTSPSAAYPLERSNLSTPTDRQNTNTSQQNLPTLEQESQILEKDTEEILERKHRKAKRKRSEPTPETNATTGQEEDQVSRSPPSWLFDTAVGSGAEEGISHKQGQTEGKVSRKTSTLHSDGKSFSFIYQVSGQNLQDFSRFKVDNTLLKWALNYLIVQKQTNSCHSTVTFSQTSPDRNKVT
ncbi:hypothetical protein EXN66_Car004941 [Channa argus]|uniref:Shelterin complex subunit TPP1/Est3 domain-containing protein n=1 Tax=Channa argus TaxID=215402 RepID=A0A6G1PGD6_CHAAH|nr:hypothetical protein EXN66_Car004941 [Channa argus]